MLTKAANWVGMIGIILFYPIQDWQMLRTGDATGLSSPAFLVLLLGCVGFSTVGWRTRNMQLLLANAVAVGFCVLTLFLIAR